MIVKDLIKRLLILPKDAKVVLMQKGSGDEYEVLNISKPASYEEYNEVYLLF
jgi:hypothetical protein